MTTTTRTLAATTLLRWLKTQERAALKAASALSVADGMTTAARAATYREVIDHVERGLKRAKEPK